MRCPNCDQRAMRPAQWNLMAAFTSEQALSRTFFWAEPRTQQDEGENWVLILIRNAQQRDINKNRLVVLLREPPSP